MIFCFCLFLLIDDSAFFFSFFSHFLAFNYYPTAHPTSTSDTTISVGQLLFCLLCCSLFANNCSSLLTPAQPVCLN